MKRVAVIGLGRIGSRFDEEAGRTAVWSHAGAYLALPDRYRLCAGVEPDDANAAAFARRCPEAVLYRDVAEMLAAESPEVVSICTPAPTHAEALEAVLAVSSVKAVWCEKPFTTDAADARRLAERTERGGPTVYVSHVRRWTAIWRRAAERLAAGDIGRLTSLRVDMPNRLWSVGSHAVDLALYLGGSVAAATALPAPALDEDGEPAVGALIRFGGGALGAIAPTGYKAGLTVSAELYGDEGRLSVDETAGRLALSRYTPSGRYDGYRVLAAEETERLPALSGRSPFIEIARDIADGAVPRCTARDALDGMRVLQVMADAAKSPPSAAN